VNHLAMGARPPGETTFASEGPSRQAWLGTPHGFVFDESSMCSTLKPVLHLWLGTTIYHRHSKDQWFSKWLAAAIFIGITEIDNTSGWD